MKTLSRQYRKSFLTQLKAMLLLSFPLFACSQDSVPTLKGKVHLSIKTGTISCDFVLSNIPNIEDYVIRLNTGMNIHYIRDNSNGQMLNYEQDHEDNRSSEESIAYYFPGKSRGSRILPKCIQFRYMGMYPVTDSLQPMVSDWRGNVALNGSTLRVDGRQSAWYPVLYDRKLDIVYEKVLYDVEVRCDDCSSLFVNGSAPAPGPVAQFRSDVPRQLTMFCGNYAYQQFERTYILNPDIDVRQQAVFGQKVNQYRRFYEQVLKIPYKEPLSFIRTMPVAWGYGFLFVSFPSIIMVTEPGRGLGRLFDPAQAGAFKFYLAHELAHYYFGHYRVPNSTFSGVIDESFAELLAMEATRALEPDSTYLKTVQDKRVQLRGFKATPLARLTNTQGLSQRQTYLYHYVPVLLTAIEKEIGKDKFFRWLRLLLQSQTSYTDYAFLIKTLGTAVNDEKMTNGLIQRYFESDNALTDAWKIIDPTK
ncbi:hypothetical protein [Paraflavitalea pollutisoli]|uniref:hypothetical protein n=1 Tax=Paraflavitalea pollutisoli TaxID=3034143 RepID=UPI0023EE1373|nr:hypothetical protein [Paraflavitalea sp. H1-2-19X]